MNLLSCKKPVMLYCRPDLTPFPCGFTHAVVAVYPTWDDADWDAAKKLVENELSRYVCIAAVDADAQAERLLTIMNAEDAGFDGIELDEQVSRNTLTAKEFNELVNKAHIPIGVTGPPACIYGRIADDGMAPSLINVEFYDDPFGRIESIATFREIYSRPIIGVVDLRNPNGRQLFEISREVWDRLDGIWLWGWSTANQEWNQASAKNLNTLRSLLNLFGRP